MDWRQEEALWRYSLIREAVDARLSCGERGALVRSLAARLHAHPSGELRAVGRSTLDDWIRAYRAGGFQALLRGSARRYRGHRGRCLSRLRRFDARTRRGRQRRSGGSSRLPTAGPARRRARLSGICAGKV